MKQFFEEAVLNTAQAEFSLHPEATLIDYYKLFFQATFGPKHFMLDEISAKNWLKQELASAQSFEPLLFQCISYKRTFYRVNLAVILRKLVSPADFLAGFIASSLEDIPLAKNIWIEEWQQIEQILQKSPLKIEDFEEASRKLQNQLNAGDMVVSHSSVFRQTYHPHYRLFNETEFKKLGL